MHCHLNFTEIEHTSKICYFIGLAARWAKCKYYDQAITLVLGGRRSSRRNYRMGALTRSQAKMSDDQCNRVCFSIGADYSIADDPNSKRLCYANNISPRLHLLTKL